MNLKNRYINVSISPLNANLILQNCYLSMIKCISKYLARKDKETAPENNTEKLYLHVLQSSRAHVNRFLFELTVHTNNVEGLLTNTNMFEKHEP